MGLVHIKSDEGVVTISAGVSHESAKDFVRDSWKFVVEEADRALYRAKESGRNRMILWDSETALKNG